MKHFKNDEVIEPNRNSDTSCCPVCNNTMGFAMGTCVSCGFNYISADFNFIKVHVDHLPKELKNALVKYHAKTYGVESINDKKVVMHDSFDY